MQKAKRDFIEKVTTKEKSKAEKLVQLYKDADRQLTFLRISNILCNNFLMQRRAKKLLGYNHYLENRREKNVLLPS